LREQIDDLQKRVTSLEESLKSEQTLRSELIKNEASLRTQVNIQKEQIDKLEVENLNLAKRLGLALRDRYPDEPVDLP
jgi:predicted nuclease with TOPRIM domain